MKKFSELKSVKKLAKLAQHPIDFSQKDQLTSDRVREMILEMVGIKFFYSTERVTKEVITALSDLAIEAGALEHMMAMQSGEVVNIIDGYDSECRPALHTAMRGFFAAEQLAPKATAAAIAAHQEIEKLRLFLEQHERQFSYLVQIGIGGSDLGPHAIYLALEAYQLPKRKVFFASNVDPDDLARVLAKVELEKTLFVVVSKSGTTLETQTNEAFVRQELTKAGIKAERHIVAVTGKGSPMDDPKRYLASFYIWDYVGGRYSVTSMVGAVTLGFALGIERLLEFLKGAHNMDQHALVKEPLQNLPLLSALLGIWNRNFLGHETTAIIPYSQALSRFPAHLQQLNMESNGKHIDKQGTEVDFSTGPIIWGEPGTNGQHSFFQLIHQGTSIVPIEFIGFEHSQYQQDLLFKGTTSQEKLLANMFAQSLGLATGEHSENPNKVCHGNRPSQILLAEKLTPFAMGSLLAFYEHKVAFQGFIWNINSFDQEGVQLGKKLALQVMEQFESMRRDQKLHEDIFPLSAAYLAHLGRWK